jgi:hypothetical protein
MILKLDTRTRVAQSKNKIKVRDSSILKYIVYNIKQIK